MIDCPVELFDKKVSFEVNVVTHLHKRQTRTGHVEKCKIEQTSESHTGQVRNVLHVRLVRLVYFDVSRYTSMHVPCVFGLKIFLSMLKHFLEARRISGVCLTCYE